MATKVLVAFYSRNGSIEAFARAAAEGARAEGAEVTMRRAREVVSRQVMEKAPGWAENADRMNAEYEPPTAADAEWADAIIFGTPSRFGAVCAELKAYIDSLVGLWAQGTLTDKPASVFSASSTLHGGNEATILSLYPPLSHLGMIIVPLGYTDPGLYKAGSPYGATAATGRGDARRLPNDAETAIAFYQGQRVTRIASRLQN
jgi:NAD(P)H dehydrogenase (quinone)